MTTPTFDTATDVLDKWRPIAEQQPETSPIVPVNVLAGEALDLSFFIQEMWESSAQNVPGMKEAAVGGMFNPEIAEELGELSVAISTAHSKSKVVIGQSLVAPVERGEFLVSELKRSLEYLFDDGVDDEKDAALEQLNSSFSEFNTHDELAQALDAYAYYAVDFRDQLAALPDFSDGYLDEALAVARRLREQSAIKLSREVQNERAEWIRLRNRLVTLVVERLRIGRRAARYVYRNHPEIARRASSSYERRRSLQRRRVLREREAEATASPSNGQPQAQPEPTTTP